MGHTDLNCGLTCAIVAINRLGRVSYFSVSVFFFFRRAFVLCLLLHAILCVFIISSAVPSLNISLDE